MKTLRSIQLALLAPMLACGDQSGIEHGSSVSDCGGFSPASNALTVDDGAYCDAEVLHWEYDANHGTLDLLNTRTLLNCCGDHDTRVEKISGGFAVTEIDAPEAGSRCSCMCVFDWSVIVDDVHGDAVTIRLLRNVTDSDDGQKLIIEGKLDLRACSGFEVIDETDADIWCSQDT